MHSQLTNVSNVTTDVYSICVSFEKLQVSDSIAADHQQWQGGDPSFSSVLCTELCHDRTNMINP